jgi:hypothetical protein
MEEDKKAAELSIFEAFAAVCPMHIDLRSISQSEEFPDITCLTVEGAAVGFELVEAVDRTIADNKTTDLQSALHESIARLPQKDQALILGRSVLIPCMNQPAVSAPSLLLTTLLGYCSLRRRNMQDQSSYPRTSLGR